MYLENTEVLILGKGVSGLSTAWELLKRRLHVTIWSPEAPDELPPTSSNAYAMWWPVQSNDDACVERWAWMTFREFERLSQVPDSGITMRQNFQLKTSLEVPWYADRLPCFRHAFPGEVSHQYAGANVLDTAPIIEPGVYLPWLYKQVCELGAKIEQRPKVERLTDCPPQFPVIINCTGMGAPQLLREEGHDLYPARLQVVKVRQTGFDKVVWAEDGPNGLACIVPHRDYIQLGAVYDEYKHSTRIDDRLTGQILERCSNMVPGFQVRERDIIDVTRCVRLKQASGFPLVKYDQLDDGRLVCHNVAHNGTGFTLSLGIAEDIATQVDTAVI